ncbi:hypothetical protein [Pararhodobacter sp.]|uniref:hypothetical protein n=1 Tax=Pararhodobacter sp. TaxID=2127056 RepID=UPI002AFF95A4|nr:hypothetical protein [Pararhodobacter sp.]
MTALARAAGILCNDARFQRFVAQRIDLPTGQATASAAAEYLRRQCRIDSRRQLDTDPAAASRFAALRTDFDAWRGRIATPR